MEEDRGAFKTNSPPRGRFDHFVKARKPRFFTGLARAAGTAWKFPPAKNDHSLRQTGKAVAKHGRCIEMPKRVEILRAPHNRCAILQRA
jgi:hypothetical protein